ncbi:hypothetical protein OSB04_009847 [Centaurea solstitialis]|uniref:Uncharacterized protein n=1 Tax=Centaurea solstitialis TaxID=347529 RepID=A0AA38TR92_9ASTR|nr:hypothetical protein OSB04_009847 [Centaurea solstitialis]
MGNRSLFLSRFRLQAYKLERPPKMAGSVKPFMCVNVLSEEGSVIPQSDIRVNGNNRCVV